MQWPLDGGVDGLVPPLSHRQDSVVQHLHPATPPDQRNINQIKTNAGSIRNPIRTEEHAEGPTNHRRTRTCCRRIDRAAAPPSRRPPSPEPFWGGRRRGPRMGRGRERAGNNQGEAREKARTTRMDFLAKDLRSHGNSSPVAGERRDVQCVIDFLEHKPRLGSLKSMTSPRWCSRGFFFLWQLFLQDDGMKRCVVCALTNNSLASRIYISCMTNKFRTTMVKESNSSFQRHVLIMQWIANKNPEASGIPTKGTHSRNSTHTSHRQDETSSHLGCCPNRLLLLPLSRWQYSYISYIHH